MEYKNDIIKHEHDYDMVCKKEYEVYAGISAPIEIKPKAIIGDITVECCGDPIVDTDNCGECYKIVITQQVLIKIPVSYCVKAEKCKEDK